MRLTKLSALGSIVADVLVLAAAPAWAAVKGSKHDLGSGGAAQATTTATTEVCVFCHTPHGSDANVSAPLWNKTVPAAGSYTRYSSLGSATLDGAEVAVGSVSLACLSCHDGSQAMDVVLNAPGTGNYSAAGAELDLTAIGQMTPAGGPIPNLGTDLRNDHPVSIAFAGGACVGTSAACDPSLAASGDKDFKTAQFQLINAQPTWWVDTTGGVASQRDKTDMILYTRSFSGTNGPSVECGSCHDPHESTPRPVSFLRISNDGSTVCLSCHIK